MITIRTTKHSHPISGQARITAKATIDGKRKQLTVPYYYALSAIKNHENAARYLGRKHKLGVSVFGAESHETGYTWGTVSKGAS